MRNWLNNLNFLAIHFVSIFLASHFGFLVGIFNLRMLQFHIFIMGFPFFIKKKLLKKEYLMHSHAFQFESNFNEVSQMRLTHNMLCEHVADILKE